MESRESIKVDDEMLSLKAVRSRGLGAVAKMWADPSQWLQNDVMKHIQAVDFSRYLPQQNRTRILRPLLCVVAIMLCLFKFYSYETPASNLLTPEFEITTFNTSSRLPHIPPKIFQIFTSFSSEAMEPYIYNINSWIVHSPSHTYSILDGAGALSIISKLSKSPVHAHILPLFYSMSRRVVRADFLRYLVLAVEGGVYSDIDTELVKPIHDWVPDEFRNRTRLIIGLEADQSPPIPGTTYEVQFCQWTLAATAGHPVLWRMVDRILEHVKQRPFQDPLPDVDFSNDEVLGITGPAGWTEVVYEYLDSILDEKLTWENLTGMREPRLYGDVLILPIDGFATGAPHSGASTETADGTLVKHQFTGAWKGGEG